MKRTKEMQWRWQLLAGVMTIVMVVLLAVFAEGFSIVSHAESAAKVTASSAKIRKEPNASSESIGSAAQDKVISIKSQVQGSDGYTWYEVYVDANTLGYIRSDLVQITDGTTPPAGTAPTASTTTTTPAATPTPTPIPDEALVDVTAVNPASASVTGGESVRIRQNASTTSRIITTVKNGMALTITGTATGTDSKTWYQVTFISDGTEVTGFIRSDYTTVKPEELTPYEEEPPVEEPVSEEPQDTQEPEETKAFDTVLQGDSWWLVDTATGNGYDIQELFDGVEKNGKLYEESMKTVKTQKIVIIILVILLVGTAAAVTLLIFKVKDMTDAQYFNEVENETMKRRGTRSQGSGQKVMQTVGSERQGARSAGTRPAGAAQGQRPQGSRPAGTAQGQPRQSTQGSRPAGAAQGQPRQSAPGGRPVGAAQGQLRQSAPGSRPAGAVQSQPRQSASGSRPVGAVQGQPHQSAPGSRPVGTAQGQPHQSAPGSRPAGAVQGQPRQNTQGQRPAQGQQNPGWQSKNFLDDDDEFEFEFLNYDGNEEQ